MSFYRWSQPNYTYTVSSLNLSGMRQVHNIRLVHDYKLVWFMQKLDQGEAEKITTLK